MNLVTTRSMTPWMRTSVRQNLTRQTFTSKLASSCYAVGKAMECLARLVRLYLKTSTLKHIKPPALLALQDPNGGRRRLNLNSQVHSSHRHLVGEDLQKSIHQLSLSTRMIHETRLEALSHHKEHLVHDKSNK